MRSSLVQLPFRSTRRFLSSGSQPHLRIVAVNDVYEVHGLPRLKSLVAKHRREQEQHGGVLLTTLAGDFVSPSILSGMDQGQSMVQTLAAIPISHCCFGNHEADLKLDDLSRRVVEFEAAGCRWLNSNMPKFRPALPLWDIVDVPLAGLRVGILGLLTSEKGVFRKDTFRGLPIEDVVSTATRLSATLRAEHGVGAVVALTHQSVTADLALAQSGAVDLILGGHEHEVRLAGHRWPRPPPPPPTPPPPPLCAPSSTTSASTTSASTASASTTSVSIASASIASASIASASIASAS